MTLGNLAGANLHTSKHTLVFVFASNGQLMSTSYFASLFVACGEVTNGFRSILRPGWVPGQAGLRRWALERLLCRSFCSLVERRDDFNHQVVITPCHLGSSNISLVNTSIFIVLESRGRFQKACDLGCPESSMSTIYCIVSTKKRAGSRQDSSSKARGTESGVQISPPIPSTMPSDVWGKPHPFEFSVPRRADLATSREGPWDYRGEVENYSAPRRRLDGLDASSYGVYYGLSIVGDLDVVGFNLFSIVCTH